jgi:hypothetical protein
MKTKIVLALLVTNLLWLAAYVHLNGKRNDYRNQIVKAEDAIKTLPQRDVYYIGQKPNGNLFVYCLNQGDESPNVSYVGSRRLEITCGKPDPYAAFGPPVNADGTVAKEQ